MLGHARDMVWDFLSPVQTWSDLYRCRICLHKLQYLIILFRLKWASSLRQVEGWHVIISLIRIFLKLFVWVTLYGTFIWYNLMALPSVQLCRMKHHNAQGSCAGSVQRLISKVCGYPRVRTGSSVCNRLPSSLPISHWLIWSAQNCLQNLATVLLLILIALENLKNSAKNIFFLKKGELILVLLEMLGI